MISPQTFGARNLWADGLPRQRKVGRRSAVYPFHLPGASASSRFTATNREQVKRREQVTLPAELRKRFYLEEGDNLGLDPTAPLALLAQEVLDLLDQLLRVVIARLWCGRYRASRGVIILL